MRDLVQVTKYYVQIANDYSGLSTATKRPVAATSTSYKISGLSAGRSYYVKVTYDYNYIGYNYTTPRYDYTLGSTTLRTLPGTVTGLKQSKWWYYAKSVDVNWNAQTGVDGYEYIFRNADNKTVAHATKNYGSSAYASCKISNNHVYTIYVRAYTTINNKKYYSPYSKAYLFTQPMCTTKTKVSGNKLTISWGKIKGVSSYSVYVSTKEKTGYVKVKTVSAKTNKLTVKKLKKAKIKNNKTYYVYIVANKKVGKLTYTSGRHYVLMLP